MGRLETDTPTLNREGRGNEFEDEHEDEDEHDWGTIAGKEKRADEPAMIPRLGDVRGAEAGRKVS